MHDPNARVDLRMLKLALDTSLSELMGLSTHTLVGDCTAHACSQNGTATEQTIDLGQVSPSWLPSVSGPTQSIANASLHVYSRQSFPAPLCTLVT